MAGRYNYYLDSEIKTDNKFCIVLLIVLKYFQTDLFVEKNVVIGLILLIRILPLVKLLLCTYVAISPFTVYRYQKQFVYR